MRLLRSSILASAPLLATACSGLPEEAGTAEQPVNSPSVPRPDYHSNFEGKSAAWGDWTFWDFCAEGSFAAGFSMKVEPPQGGGANDDTSANAIRMACKNVQGLLTSYITSGESQWGAWGSFPACAAAGDFLTGMRLKVEPYQPGQHGDDTALNSARFLCASGEELAVDNDGAYGEWAKEWSSCPPGKAICGLNTRIEPPQGPGLAHHDDTALNNIAIACCSR